MAAGPTREVSSTWTPLDAAERFGVLDLIRGFSLFGVMLINLLYFFRLPLFDHILRFHSHPGWANHGVDLVMTALVEFKSFHLFALTFGIGVAIQAERAKLRGVRAEAFLARRFLILLAFGTVHMLLVSNVDILALYAVCGFIAAMLARLPTKIVAGLGIAAIYLPSILREWPPTPPQATWDRYIAQARDVYAHGSFEAIVAFRWQETRQFIWPLLGGVAQQTLGLMLLGVALWRCGVVRQPDRFRPILRAVCLLAGTVGLVNSVAEVVSRSLHRPAAVPLLEILGSDIPLALAYAAGLLAWRRSARANAILAPVAAAGRMALTNYLTQTIVMSVAFYGYGFGLFGRLDPLTAAAFGVVFYLGQLYFSEWWLRRYRFGPFEWLWRSLTYGRRQAMLKPVAPTT